MATKKRGRSNERAEGEESAVLHGSQRKLPFKGKPLVEQLRDVVREEVHNAENGTP